jgi:hypothetical protein
VSIATLAAITAVVLLGGLYARFHRSSGRGEMGHRSAPQSHPGSSQAAFATPTAASATTPRPSRRLAEAEAVVTRQGFDPIEVVGFDGTADLQMVLGHSHGSADAGREWAFFFDPKGEYLGTDAAQPTVGLDLSWSSGDTVALRYTLYHTDDPQCCPSGGAATVRFHWDGTRVLALDPIPSTTADPARR